jgi:hypothetical protein
MRWASANAHTTSNPEVFASWLLAFVRHNDIAGVSLQETTARHGRAIRKEFGESWTLKQFRHWDNAERTPSLLDKSADLDGLGRCVRLGRKGWFGWRVSKPHPPSSMTTVKTPGVTIGSTHAPPGVDAFPSGLKGKADRVAAWIAFVKAFRRWAKANPGPFVVFADWNDPAWRRGPFSIHWLAKKTGARMVTRGGIDYALVRDCRVTDAEKAPGGPGMDHGVFLLDILDIDSK